MSLRTWQKAFYPLAAEEQVAYNNGPLALVEHSLRKWRGLTNENLTTHHLVRSHKSIMDRAGNETLINDTSCALCLVYSPGTSFDCGQCPLYEVLGRRCDSSNAGPYTRFLGEGDPVPMIRWLEAARALLVARDA